MPSKGLVDLSTVREGRLKSNNVHLPDKMGKTHGKKRLIVLRK